MSHQLVTHDSRVAGSAPFFPLSERHFLPMPFRVSSLFVALILPVGLSNAALLVDFCDSTANAPSHAAPFVVASGNLSPQSAAFIAGSQGYSSPAIDSGSGITASVRVYATGGSYFNLLQLRDRNDAVADLESDWVFQGGTFDGDMARVGLQLTLSGLMSGFYNFSSLHIDTGGMSGVMDAQYSLNGGATWINTSYDNASFTDGLEMNLDNLDVTAAKGLQVRYLVGGNLFGTPGVARSGDTNFLLPLNSFSISPVPEPSLAALMLAAIPALLVRKRAR